MKKRHFLLCLVAAVGTGGVFIAAPAADDAPLRPVAELICSHGKRFPTSDLFEMLELDIPFLMIADGSEMLAAPASQCQFLESIAVPRSFILVIGHRNEVGAASFYITSMRGELIEVARGFTEKSGQTIFLTVTATELMKLEFEATKAYWLSVSTAQSKNGMHPPAFRGRRP